MKELAGGKGSIHEYKPGRWRVRVYWRGERIEIIRSKNGEILEGPIGALTTWKIVDGEIRAKTFKPSEWAKPKAFLLKNAFLDFDTGKRCEKEWQYQREHRFNKHILPELGEKDIRDVTTPEVNAFYAKLLDKKLASKTTNDIMELLKEIFIYNDLDRKIKWPDKIKIQREPVEWLTREQQACAMQFIPDQDRSIFEFLQITGCRPGEACGLQREDVEWENKRVVVRHSIGFGGRLLPVKTRNVKIIPFFIFPDISILKPKSLASFLFQRGGKPYYHRMLLRIWQRANTLASVKHGIPIRHLKNAFRHSLACQEINQGTPIEAISKMLGHSSIRITQKVYADILPETAWGHRKVAPIGGTIGVQNKNEAINSSK